jgi:hypothetical protein
MGKIPILVTLYLMWAPKDFKNRCAKYASK